MELEYQILLVEDDDFDERLALRAFAKTMIPGQVAVTRDGQEAIDHLADANNRNPDLILLDLKLPKRHGHEVLVWIRENERTKCTPVVCFSSSSEPKDIAICFERGANSFVRKPVEYDEYVDRFRRLIEYWLTINERCPDASPAGVKPA